VKGDPEEMSAEDRARLGIRRLPTSLHEALAALEADTAVCSWLSSTFLDCWKGMRRKELEIVAGLDDAALCRRYAEVY
jgi:glutamine synthetase